MATNVQNAGLAITTARLVAGTQPIPSWMGMGTGTVGSALNLTAIPSELSGGSYARTNGTVSQVTTSVTNDTWQAAGTVTNATGSSQAITDAGCLDASSVGNLYVVGDFATLNIPNGGGIAFTFQVQYTN